MADTNTPSLNLVLPEVGASSDTWGTKINSDLTAIDNLFSTGPYLKVANGGTGAGTAATAATNLGLGTGDSPQFAGVNVGHASDTTITRSAAGVIAVEGGVIPKENRANTFSAAQTFSGNVGIGISPGARLDVSDADDGPMYFRNTTAILRFRPYVTSYTSSQIAALNAAGSAYTPLAVGGSITTLESNGIERMRIDSSGNVRITSSGGLGYGTGSGGTVSQATSRTTPVTINKTNGVISLVSAAGSPTWSAFKVNNSTVAAQDTIILSARSGATNTYIIQAADVAAGSFYIFFQTTGGTSVDALVINFAVIKASDA